MAYRGDSGECLGEQSRTEEIAARQMIHNPSHYFRRESTPSQLMRCHLEAPQESGVQTKMMDSDIASKIWG